MGSESGSRTVTQTQDPYKPAQSAINAGISRLDQTYRQAAALRAPFDIAPTREQFTTTTPAQRMSWQDYYRSIGSPSDPGIRRSALEQWNRMGAGAMGQPTSVFDEAGYNAAMRNYEAARAAGPTVYEQLPEEGAKQLLSTVRGDYLNGNPYIDEVIRRSMADVNSQFQGSGRYGSGAWQDALMRGAGGIRYANYAGERQNQLAATQQAPSYSLYPYQLYKQQLESVYDPLAIYTDLATRYGNVGVQGQTTEPLYRNIGAGIMGGAAAGAGLASAIPAVAATGWGLPVAAVLGGILGGMG